MSSSKKRKTTNGTTQSFVYPDPAPSSSGKSAGGGSCERDPCYKRANDPGEGCALDLSSSKCDNTVAKMQLKMMQDPFTATSTQPKYPDGKAQWSIGVKFQQCTEVKAHQFLIALFPGVSNWCVAFDFVNVKDDQGEFQKRVRILTNHNNRERPHGVSYDVKPLPDTITDIDGKPVNGTDPPEDFTFKWRLNETVPYNSWRPCFLGLRLQSVTPKEEDNGTFETFRYTREAFLEGMGCYHRGKPGSTDEDTIWKKGQNVTLNNGNLLPLQEFFEQYVEKEKDRVWEAQPSYSYNTISTLGNYTFQLNHIRDENSFVRLRESDVRDGGGQLWHLPDLTGAEDPPLLEGNQLEFYYCKDTLPDNEEMSITRDASDEDGSTRLISEIHGKDENTLPYPTMAPREGFAVRANANSSTESVADFWKQFIADAFDIIIIRCNCDQESRITLHSSYGQEFIVNEDKPLATFQTVGYNYQEGIRKYEESRKLFQKIPYHFTTTEGKQGVFKDML